MRAILLLISLVIWPSMASAWWNDAWSYRVPVNLDTSPSTLNASAPIENSPLLLRLHSGNFEDFFLVKEDLSDLRFISDDDKTPLKFHVESFDLLNQLAFIWVQLPQLSTSPTPSKIWMYYGNQESASADDAAGSFDVAQIASFHFKANESIPQNQTGFAIQTAQFTGLVNPATFIAGGISLSGDNGLELAESPALQLNPTNGYSMMLWAKPTQPQTNAVLFSQGTTNNMMELVADQSLVYIRITQNGQRTESAKIAKLPPETWNHVALIASASAIDLYINGNKATSLAIQLAPIQGTVKFGFDGAGKRGFVGDIDELGIYNKAVSPDLVALNFANQKPMSSLVSLGAGEQLGNAGGTSYFITVFQNTSLEGWIVIGLLGIMAVVSWTVMAFKAFFLARINKDNKAFMKQYTELSNLDLASLDQEEDEDFDTKTQAESLFGKHDHFQSSPLYHIYHRGIAETRDRVSAKSSTGHLNETSVNSIRSGLEAYVVREIQGLNRNMVLLTIAVSGGPFLGLFGTVLGVMITFAAIAASGDVNIAAIAPGVAAALLTTVAGLIVAIPAMFGYNWLATRIKDMVADMHLFTEEFVSKLAEQYGADATKKVI